MSNYQRIRDLREDADLTQKQVANSLFMHKNIHSFPDVLGGFATLL